jgi:mannose-1-phosphate guanylyltransferase / phosphomannomutase
MAGGEGTRLRPLTSKQPKPMIPVVNRPMMEHVLGLLGRHGIDDVVVTVAYLANTIRNYFGDGSELGVRMVYATEEVPLGTAGSVRNASDQLDDRFLVISGDVVTDIDLSALVAFHCSTGAAATIALKAVENPLEFGIVITDADGAVRRFLEKPTWGQVFSDTVNTGIYVLEPSVLDFIPEGRPADFSGEVFPALLAAGKPVYGYVAGGYWEDVGTLEAYLRVHHDILDGKVDLEIPGFRLEHGVWLGEGTELDPEALVEGPLVIGDYCQVGPRAHVSDHTVLGSNVRVGPETFVHRSVVHEGSFLGPAVHLRGCVLGRANDLRQGASCEEGVVLGDECFVGSQAILSAGVKVYPEKTVEAGAIVNSSIVWESRAPRALFGQHGVSGLANVDLSPELAVRLSMAYGTTLSKGARVTTSRDTSRAARVLKRAIMVGLNAAGVDVDDLEAATVPVTRFHLRTSGDQGGISVRVQPGDPDSVVIRFFDDRGIDIDETTERRIERLYYREDTRRALAGELGDIDFPARALELYTGALMASVDLDAIRAARFKLVLDYAYGTTSFVMPNVLAKLGADVLALNPYGTTRGAAEVDLSAHARRVADLVRTSGAHLGALFDPDGERLTMVDDEGKVLSDVDSLLAMLSLVLSAQPQGDAVAGVALPVSATRAVEAICHAAGAEITWTKLSAAHLMEAAAGGKVAFAANQQGGFIWPSFLPAADGAAAFVHLLSILSGSGLRLSKVVAGLPKVHLAHEAVTTPWDKKGLVMRTLVESTRGGELVLVDGVKVMEDDGFILVVPDPEEPTTHVWAEAASSAMARARAASYVSRIRQALG